MVRRQTPSAIRPPAKAKEDDRQRRKKTRLNLTGSGVVQEVICASCHSNICRLPHCAYVRVRVGTVHSPLRLSLRRTGISMQSKTSWRNSLIAVKYDVSKSKIYYMIIFSSLLL